eukprot:6014671-Heterocapsa_arctica.AAC.1
MKTLLPPHCLVSFSSAHRRLCRWSRMILGASSRGGRRPMGSVGSPARGAKPSGCVGLARSAACTSKTITSAQAAGHCRISARCPVDCTRHRERNDSLQESARP